MSFFHNKVQSLFLLWLCQISFKQLINNFLISAQSSIALLLSSLIKHEIKSWWWADQGRLHPKSTVHKGSIACIRISSCFWSPLYSAFLCSHADPLHSCRTVHHSHRATVAFYSTFFNINPSGVAYSAVSLLHGWCLVKLLPFWVHHTAMHGFTVSFHSKTHT